MPAAFADELEPVRVRTILTPPAALETRIRGHLATTLGRVLPADSARGLDWYYDWVVVGGRPAEALRVIQKNWPGRPGGVLVDVGSGLGSVVLLANACGIPAVGVEPTPGSVELARERIAAALPGLGNAFTVGRGEALPVASGTASAVLLYDVLEHTPDWRAVLRDCRRVLAPDGILYVKGPAYGCRFFEPHYRLPWLPLLPSLLARAYLRLAGRDEQYFRDIFYVRRKPVLRELDQLGLSLTFPRRERVADARSINRPWARRAVLWACRLPGGRQLTTALAEGPFQATVDVVAHVRRQ